MNVYAQTGVDPEFGRGGNDYDRMFGDPTVTPNPCLGAIDTGAVLCGAHQSGRPRHQGRPEGATPGRGSSTRTAGPSRSSMPRATIRAAPFGNRYPGAGGTIGPAMTFAFVAINDIAERGSKQEGAG